LHQFRKTFGALADMIGQTSLEYLGLTQGAFDTLAGDAGAQGPAKDGGFRAANVVAVEVGGDVIL
jgi:hypothetical protein